MNVLLVVPWDQEFGGVACVVGNLAKYLTAGGHKVVFLHPGFTNVLRQRKTTWGFDGFEISLREPYSSASPLKSILAFICFLPVTLVQILALLNKRDIQVVNIHYPGECFFYFALLKTVLGFKLVVSVHGADFYPDGRPNRKHSWLMGWLLSAADRVVAPSRAFLLQFLELLPQFNLKTTAIHNGVDVAELLGAVTAQHNNLANYILCIAHQNPKKNLDQLIRAFMRVKNIDTSLSLVLVGDGPMRRTLEELAGALQLDGKIHFLGWKNRAEVAELLKGCTLFVLPSKSEPFGIVIIEAMACRKPVVASRVGGIPEIIEHGKNGIMVDPDDPLDLAGAIEALLNDPDLRESLGANGQLTVHERFTYETMGRRYESLFSRLLDAV
jgi:glycosyltransferase involved in cell wall biosynthesis